MLLSYRNVTSEFAAEYKKRMTPALLYQSIDRIKKKLIREAESQGPDLFAEIGTMYAGNGYYLFVYKKIRDVRIVYAPPRDIGNFGGDIDNWMWPRHTCDFTFLRAYVSPEGIGVEYSPDNVPYEPEVHFKIAEQGVKEGDFTFIMGYPGRTYRNFSTPELKFDIDKIKSRLHNFDKALRFFEMVSQKSKAIEIKYASNVKGLNNVLKNYRGKLESFAKVDVVGAKQTEDEKYMHWAEKNNDAYAGIVERINTYLEDEYKVFYWKENELSGLTSFRGGSALLSQANILVRASIESQKPDMERDTYYQERNLPRLKSRIQLAERRYDLDVDKEYTKMRFSNLENMSDDVVPGFIKKMAVGEGGLDAWIDKAYAETRLVDPDYRVSLLGKTPAELKALKDPLLDFAFSLEEEMSGIREKRRVMNQRLQDLKKVYLAGLLEMNDEQMAPDANSTIRFTSGPVKGYEPRDGVYYQPFTTLNGVIEKDTGVFPFHVPDKIKTLHQDKDFGNYAATEFGDVPACFLNTTNVTGGNSGSPTINANGEIIGIVFDMTYESVIGDYYIIPEFQRVISADIRYVLFVAEKFSGATHLIEEMGL